MVAEAVIGDDDKPVDGFDRTSVLGNGEYPELLAVIKFCRGGEDLIRSGEVQKFDLVEQIYPDVSHLLYPRLFLRYLELNIFRANDAYQPHCKAIPYTLNHI